MTGVRYGLLMWNRTRVRVVAVLAFVALTALPASGTPSFDLVLSCGGVEELAVGEQLHFSAYRPAVHRNVATGEGTKALAVPLKWSVSPPKHATITSAGVLTALEPGAITVRAQDARTLAPGELPAGMPGVRGLSIRTRASLPAKRLPQVVGVPRLSAFSLQWRREPKQPKAHLFVRLVTTEWILWFEALPPEGSPLPWTCRALAKERSFLRNTYHGPGMMRDTWRKNLIDAQVVISSWKDDIARGQFTASTKPGPRFDARFVARLPDSHLLLRKATPPAGSSAK